MTVDKTWREQLLVATKPREEPAGRSQSNVADPNEQSENLRPEPTMVDANSQLLDLTHLPQLLTIQEASSLLRVSRATVYRLIDQGQIPSFRVGRSRRIPAQALIRGFTSGGK